MFLILPDNNKSSQTKIVAPNLSSAQTSQTVPRVKKACNRCRLKKIKCDGYSPCHRCKHEKIVCQLDHRSNADVKELSKSYIASLESQLSSLQDTLQRISQYNPDGNNFERLNTSGFCTGSTKKPRQPANKSPETSNQDKAQPSNQESNHSMQATRLQEMNKNIENFSLPAVPTSNLVETSSLEMLHGDFNPAESHANILDPRLLSLVSSNSYSLDDMICQSNFDFPLSNEPLHPLHSLGQSAWPVQDFPNNGIDMEGILGYVDGVDGVDEWRGVETNMFASVIGL